MKISQEDQHTVEMNGCLELSDIWTHSTYVLWKVWIILFQFAIFLYCYEIGPYPRLILCWLPYPNMEGIQGLLNYIANNDHCVTPDQILSEFITCAWKLLGHILMCALWTSMLLKITVFIQEPSHRMLSIRALKICELSDSNYYSNFYGIFFNKNFSH